MNDSRIAICIYAVTNSSCQYFTAPSLNLLRVGRDSIGSCAVEGFSLGLSLCAQEADQVSDRFPAVFMAVAPSAAVPTAAPSSSVHSSRKSGTP